MRKYTLQKKYPHFISKPSHIIVEEDHQNLFEPLLAYTSKQREKQEDYDQISVFRPHVPSTCTFVTPEDEVLKSRIIQIGSKIKVRWTKEETRSMG